MARNTRYAVNVLSYAVILKHWRFARAVCFSEHVARRLIGFGCEAAKVAVVPLGTPDVTERVAVNREGMCLFRENEFPRILTVAGIAHHKGIHDVLHALPSVVAAYPTLRYVVIGSVRDYGYAAHLEQVVRLLQLTRNVSFISNASDFLKNVALEEADLYIQPSHEEGFCLAFLEAAMKTGRLVGTRTGEMPGIAANDPLMHIVPRMKPGALRQSILKLIEVPVTREVVAARRIRLENKYSWTKFTACISSLYKDILHNPGVPGETPVEL